MQQLNKLLIISFLALAASGCGSEKETQAQESAASTSEVVSEEAEQQDVTELEPAELLAEAGEQDTVVDEDASQALEQAQAAGDKLAEQVKGAKELGELKKADLTDGVWREGKVQFLQMEGGFFGIVTKSGEKFLPLNMDKSARKHGSVIQFKGVVAKDVMTIQQWGTPIKITDIKVIKEGSSVNPGLM